MKERKLTIGIALVLIVFSLFVSCSGEIDEPGIGNEDAYARFVYGNSRSIGVSYDIADFNELYWFYTATKIDEFGTKGETTNPVPVAGTADIPEQGLNAKLGPFSQGKWKFTLTAYNDAEQKSKVYEGSVETSLSAGDNIVSLTVEPQGTTGTVKFINAFFSWNKENDTATGVPTFEFKLTKEDGTEYISILAQAQLIKVNEKYSITGNLEIPSTSGATSADIPTGDYSCSISVYYTVDEEKYEIYAQNFNFQVFASTETVLYGEITEEVFSSVTFDPSKSDLVIFDENTSVVTVPVVPNSDADEQTTTIDFGSNVFSSEGELALTVKAMSENEASEGFTAIDSSTQAAVAAIDFTLTNNGTEVNTFVNGNVEIVTYIAKGLNKESLQLVYVTDGQIADSQNGHEITDYEPATGKLVFTTNHFSTFYVTTKMDGGEKGFAGGAGTQAHPYLISNANQFKAVENQTGYYYYELTNDIAMEGNFNVNSFSGVLDGNGHSLILKEADTRHPSTEECGLILEVSDAVFKDLDYYMTGIKSLVLSVKGETSFQNVDVYGDITLIDNNVAGYMVYAKDTDEYDIVFDSCTSYANYDDPEGTHYGAHFVAYYPLNNNVKFSFTDCSVEGQFFSGRSGVLFGNSSRIASWGKNVEVKNLVINGEITSIQYNYPAGIISWGNVSEYDDELKKSTTGTENLKTFEDNIELTNYEGKIKFSAKGSSSEEIARFSVSGLSNIYYVNGSEGSYVTTMHRTWTFTLAEVEGPSDELDSSKYVVVDASYKQLPEGQEFFTSFQNSEDETCYYVGNNEPDYQYAYFGSSDKNGAFTKDDDGKVKFGHFAVSAYDAAGNLIGYKSIANN